MLAVDQERGSVYLLSHHNKVKVGLIKLKLPKFGHPTFIIKYSLNLVKRVSEHFDLPKSLTAI